MQASPRALSAEIRVQGRCRVLAPGREGGGQTLVLPRHSSSTAPLRLPSPPQHPTKPHNTPQHPTTPFCPLLPLPHLTPSAPPPAERVMAAKPLPPSSSLPASPRPSLPIPASPSGRLTGLRGSGGGASPPTPSSSTNGGTNGGGGGTTSTAGGGLSSAPSLPPPTYTAAVSMPTAPVGGLMPLPALPPPVPPTPFRASTSAGVCIALLDREGVGGLCSCLGVCVGGCMSGVCVGGGWGWGWGVGGGVGCLIVCVCRHAEPPPLG